MRIILLHNPVSGRGAGAAAAERLLPALVAAGHTVTCVATQVGDARAWLPDDLHDAEALVVVGGDGTVRSIASAAVAAGVAVLQVPLGTENLLARGLQMRSTSESVIQTLEAGHVIEVDLAQANGSPMLLMASAGLDAEVVEYVTERRRTRVSKWLYVQGLLRCLAKHQPPVCALHVDGECVFERGQGWIVIANAPDYGGRLDPAPDAVLNDGLLDVVFMPGATSWSMLGWIARTRLNVHRSLSEVVTCRGSHVRVTFEVPASWQMDGETPEGEGRISELVVELHHAPFMVFRPPWMASCRALGDHC